MVVVVAAVAGAVRSVEGEDEEHDRGVADHRRDVRQHQHAQNHLRTTFTWSHFNNYSMRSSVAVLRETLIDDQECLT